MKGTTRNIARDLKAICDAKARLYEMDAALAGLSARGFEVLLPVQLPCNDGGLSYGQVADFIGRKA